MNLSFSFLGRKCRRRRTNPVNSPATCLENLEERKLLTASATLANGVLAVQGTEFSDAIHVTNNGVVTVSIQNNETGLGMIKSFPSASVNRLRIYANSGNDLVYNQTDLPDYIEGGTGNDYIIGGRQRSIIDGGTGNDTIAGSEGDDVIRGGAGHDVIGGELGNDLIFGNAGNDTISGGEGDDDISGDAGIDRISGGTGADTLHGGSGGDAIYGDAGDDKLLGHDGDDHLEGGAGNDHLQGHAGADRMWGGDGNDLMQGGDGADTLSGGFGNDVLYGNAGMDVLFGKEGNDFLYGGAATDGLSGDGGDDYLDGGEGAVDYLDGGPGYDYGIADWVFDDGFGDFDTSSEPEDTMGRIESTQPRRRDQVRAIASGDIDNDGIPERYTAIVQDGRSEIYRSEIPGLTGERIYMSPAAKYEIHALAVGDVDGDGTDELYISLQHEHGRAYIYRSDTGYGVGSSFYSSSTAHSWTVVALATGDSDLDGRDELYSSFRHRQGESRLYRSDSAQSIGKRIYSSTYWTIPEMTLGDINGDGRDELYTVRQSRSGRARLNRSDTGFGIGLEIYRSSTFTITALAAADVDGNGYAELYSAFKSSGGTTAIYRSETGTGKGPRIYISSAPGIWTVSAMAADANGLVSGFDRNNGEVRLYHSESGSRIGARFHSSIDSIRWMVPEAEVNGAITAGSVPNYDPDVTAVSSESVSLSATKSQPSGFLSLPTLGSGLSANDIDAFFLKAADDTADTDDDKDGEEDTEEDGGENWNPDFGIPDDSVAPQGPVLPPDRIVPDDFWGEFPEGPDGFDVPGIPDLVPLPWMPPGGGGGIKISGTF